MMLTCQSSLTQNCPKNGPALAEYDRLMFSARADKPMRLWVQLWLQVHTGNRYWRRSVYLDNTERDVSVNFDDLKPQMPQLPRIRRCRRCRPSCLLWISFTRHLEPVAESGSTMSGMGARLSRRGHAHAYSQVHR